MKRVVVVAMLAAMIVPASRMAQAAGKLRRAINGKEAYAAFLAAARQTRPDAALRELQTGIFPLRQDGTSEGWFAWFVSPSTGETLSLSFSYGTLVDLGADRPDMVQEHLAEGETLPFDTARLYALAVEAGAGPHLAAGAHISAGLLQRRGQGPWWSLNISGPDHRVVGHVVIDARTLAILQANLGPPPAGGYTAAKPREAPPSTLVLPRPPPGYVWQRLSHIEGAVAVRRGWTFREDVSDVMAAYFVTERPFPQYGMFDTGMSLIVLRDVRSSLGKRPSDHVRETIESTRRSWKTEKTWQTKLTGRPAWGVMYVGQGQTAGRRFYELHVPDDDRGHVYSLTFKAPVARWSAVWRTFATMRDKLILPPPAFSSNGVS